MKKNQSLCLGCLLGGVLGGPGVWEASTNAIEASTNGIAASANAKPDSASANAAPANVKAASTGNAKAAPADAQFDQLVDDFVLGTLALSRTAATSFG